MSPGVLPRVLQHGRQYCPILFSLEVAIGKERKKAYWCLKHQSDPILGVPGPQVSIYGGVMNIYIMFTFSRLPMKMSANSSVICMGEPNPSFAEAVCNNIVQRIKWEQLCRQRVLFQVI
jgi:hypothetical protein